MKNTFINTLAAISIVWCSPNIEANKVDIDKEVQIECDKTSREIIHIWTMHASMLWSDHTITYIDELIENQRETEQVLYKLWANSKEPLYLGIEWLYSNNPDYKESQFYYRLRLLLALDDSMFTWYMNGTVTGSELELRTRELENAYPLAAGADIKCVYEWKCKGLKIERDYSNEYLEYLSKNPLDEWREDSTLKGIDEKWPINEPYLAITFWALHDFSNNVIKWNKENPNKKFCLSRVD